LHEFHYVVFSVSDGKAASALRHGLDLPLHRAFANKYEAHVLIPALESLEKNPPEHPLQIVVIDNASVLPKPVSKIPVILGGGGSNLGRSTSPKAVQRIAKRADGWLPLLTTPGPAGAAELRASWDRIREMASAYGRDTKQRESTGMHLGIRERC